MSQSLKRFRIVAFAHQAGRCYYCGLPMWTQDPLSFARQYGITPRQAKRLQCTAEHLKARQDGGEDSFANLVAACLYCNQMRHRYKKVAPTPDRYRNRVQARCLVSTDTGRGSFRPPSLL